MGVIFVEAVIKADWIEYHAEVTQMGQQAHRSLRALARDLFDPILYRLF